MELDQQPAKTAAAGAASDEIEDLSFWTLKISESLAHNEFQYQPLQQDETRLVTLLPQNAGYPIFYEISHVTFEPKPTYEALSYTVRASQLFNTFWSE